MELNISIYDFYLRTLYIFFRQTSSTYQLIYIGFSFYAQLVKSLCFDFVWKLIDRCLPYRQ